MQKARVALALALALPGSVLAALVAGPASAGVYYADPELTAAITLDGVVVNNHEYDMTYSCGTDGAITFLGVGSGVDVSTETISGAIDTTNRTLAWAGAYNIGNDYTYTTTGSLAGTATVGTIPYSAAGLDSDGLDFGVSGSFLNVPNCAPAPVAGNHGQYVSGAAKAGVKGAALAAIAKDSSKIGPYPG